MNKPDHSIAPTNNPRGEDIVRRAEEYDIPLAGDLDLIAALGDITPPDELPEELEAVICTLFAHANEVRDQVNQRND
ncbi:hypothetical protein HH1059_08790 [Halorhodospira halochloris]|uniref:Uncharacterized protein n=1 Tax=Halorhodospira halochloris TaxID=1052 RepID=A0A0X8X9K0_HALHR|nr:hypothetical protein [Halorhodospira halochloris]MBK1651292.1 hypothetical protein [Halorhodospira halochloris]MCG5548617.1 hypothetical protein [Halorhodospira halochloris]BAU57572.1 hypothetical protein HH1059_08790 [Halorhodospira halochloris]